MTYEGILDLTGAALNDQARGVYTNAVLLPYLNMARMECQEIFEQNNIPVTNATSTVITVPDGDTAIGFNGTVSLPTDLIEIRQLWESETGQDTFVPMSKKEFLTGYDPGDTQRTFFSIWSWQEQEIRLLSAIVDIDVKIDYIRSLFPLLTINDLAQKNPVVNTDLFLQYRVAGLAAEFIGENPTRATGLNGNAIMAIERSLGISIKGKQSIVTRRLPFRARFKARRRIG